MSPTLIGILGILLLVVLIFSRMWLAFAMAFVGFIGYGMIQGFDKALIQIGSIPFTSVASYPLSAIPLFIFMGSFLSNTQISTDLYTASNKWLGQLRGGLAMATIIGCGSFAAVCGSSSATAATIGKVALPEMKKYNYSDMLATGTVAAGGTLGILIPPSAGFILFGILTENSIGKLFMAGLFPGILLILIMMAIVYVMSWLNPALAPKGAKTPFIEKITSLKYIWTIILLFGFVLGGLYMGVFTPTEAGSLGAFGAIIISIINRRLTMKVLTRSMLEAGEISAMIMILLAGAYIFSPFLAVSKIPFLIADYVGSLETSPYLILATIVVVYIFLGMFLEIITCQILTLPILYPTIQAIGFDPIWFGVIFVITQELGMITPPIGMNVFVLRTVTDVPLSTMFLGIWPFALAMVLAIVMLTIFPQIALFLPNLM